MKNKELKKRVNKMFAALRKQGFFAEQNFLFDDGGCWGAIPCNYKNAVFYNEQMYDMTFVYGEEGDDLYIAWDGDVGTVLKEAMKAGLAVEWEGREDRKVCVSIPKELP
ncbi:MAG: hypothetical protein WC774_01195 [Candidatus Gracilibacteria bacterium]